MAELRRSVDIQWFRFDTVTASAASQNDGSLLDVDDVRARVREVSAAQSDVEEAQYNRLTSHLEEQKSGRTCGDDAGGEDGAQRCPQV